MTESPDRPAAAQAVSGSAPPPQTWVESLRAGLYVQGHARATVEGAGAPSVAALDDLRAVQAGVRARQYAVATRRLLTYRETLAESPDAPVFRAAFDDAGAGPALAALEAAEGSRGQLDPDGLRARLGPALAHPLTRAEAHNALGVLHALQDDPAAARLEFDAALSHDPGHYRALTNIGNLLLEAGQPAEAEVRYRQAIGLNAEYHGAHHNLAVALRKQRRLNESVREVKTSQRLLMRQSREQDRAELRQKLGGLGKWTSDPRFTRAVIWVIAALVLLYVFRDRIF